MNLDIMLRAYVVNCGGRDSPLPVQCHASMEMVWWCRTLINPETSPLTAKRVCAPKYTSSDEVLNKPVFSKENTEPSLEGCRSTHMLHSEAQLSLEGTGQMWISAVLH